MKATTEKIKVKVNVAPKYNELEVSFPYGGKDGCVLVKFFDKRKGIMVTDYGFSKQIQYMDMPEDWLTFNPITEEEFNAKFNEVMTDLKEKNNEKTI